MPYTSLREAKLPALIARCRFRRLIGMMGVLVVVCISAAPAAAEPNRETWLRFDRLDAKAVEERQASLPAVVVALGDSPVIAAARDELLRGVQGMLGQTLRVESKLPPENAILLATFDDAKKAIPSLDDFPALAEDGFWYKSIEVEGKRRLLILAPNDRGVLYGVFTLLRRIALLEPLGELNETHSPASTVRALLHWDGLNGSVDDVADASLFWDDGHITKDLDPVRDYARLLASVGISAISINEPRVGERLVTGEHREELAKLAGVLRPWGIRLMIATNSIAPPSGNWEKPVAELYEAIPDFGGFILDVDWSADKTAASAEERAAALNAIASALRPHNGVVLCRTCVCSYPSAAGEADSAGIDPAKVAYEVFKPLDGKLDENVVLQIKLGPMDFQVREPPSPLLGALKKTNQAIELQLTQRHLGQQRHLCFLVPMWKQTLDFNMHAKKGETPVKQLVVGKTFKRPLGGFVAISNARRADNWFGHELAPANLYGFGRLAWDPNLAGKAVADEWSRLTFGHDPHVVGMLVEMLLKSWRIYENYTGPLGGGTLTDAQHSQYGPGIEAPASNGWTPWLNADQTGLGTDRTEATGTGFIAQYRPPVAKRFEAVETCPDELLLFMHHVPYTHVLKSGKTVIQHIYDSHYEGARDIQELAQKWESLAGQLDAERYRRVLEQLQYQAGHAQLWRDAVCSWFMQRSGIADNEGRVGNYPNRFEAEAMTLENYEAQNVSPWETASGGQAAVSTSSNGKGAVSMKYEGPAGWYNLYVRYFDENDGASNYELFVAGQPVDHWTADASLPATEPNGHTSTRRRTPRVALRPGDTIRIEATPHAGERAAIDYLEIEPAGK